MNYNRLRELSGIQEMYQSPQELPEEPKEVVPDTSPTADSDPSSKRLDQIIVVMDVPAGSTTSTQDMTIDDVMTICSPTELVNLIKGCDKECNYSLYPVEARAEAEADAHSRISDHDQIMKYDDTEAGKTSLENDVLSGSEWDDPTDASSSEPIQRESADAAPILMSISLLLGFVPELIDIAKEHKVFKGHVVPYLSKLYSFFKKKLSSGGSDQNVDELAKSLERVVNTMNDSDPEVAALKGKILNAITHVKDPRDGRPLRDKLEILNREIQSAVTSYKNGRGVSESVSEDNTLPKEYNTRVKSLLKDLDDCVAAHNVRYKHSYMEDQLDDAGTNLKMLEVCMKLKHFIQEGKVNQATTYYTSLTNIYQDKIPVSVRKFLQSGGQEHKHLKDYFKVTGE